MRLRLRYSLLTFLMLPLLVGIGIKWYRGPHQYTLADEREWQYAEALRGEFGRYCILGESRREGTIWAYRNFDGSRTRHGPEISMDSWGNRWLIEYRNGRMHGEARYWSSDGDRTVAGQYENDQPVGEWVYSSDGLAYRRVQYEHNEGQEVESRFDLERLAERRVKTLGADEMRLTAWHTNGRKRLEGRFVNERPDGEWRWWDKDAREIRRVAFHDGVPAELVGQPRLEQFMDAALYVDFQDVPLQDALDYLADWDFKTRIECPECKAGEIRSRAISTTDDLQGAAAFYLALRDVGLTLDVRVEEDDTEVLLILPADAK